MTASRSLNSSARTREKLLEILSSNDSGVCLPVFAKPRASRNRLVGIHDGMLKVDLAAPPVDGAANKALVRYLADVLSLKRSSVKLISGRTGRRKRLQFDRVSAEELVDLILRTGLGKDPA